MNKNVDLYSLALAIMFHLLLILVLWLVVIRSPSQSEEGGVPVLLGDMGNLYSDYQFNDINYMPAPSRPLEPVESHIEAPPIITQSYEESVAIKSGEESTAQKESVETAPQQTEAEIKAETERRAAIEAQQLMRSLFSQGESSFQESSHTDITQVATLGSVEGNSEAGKIKDVGGYGTFDLGGRSIVGDGLPKPLYDVQDEGLVMVTITVDPKGNVIATRIHKRTNTINTTLRNAAESAARKTKFNAIDGVDNQEGTITYYFKLR
ncbi:MAG TPA: energy transducer TonB [Bacteroidaceae bacterium]|nr:energy transducer TonB [Bacteroidaceae bacterium]